MDPVELQQRLFRHYGLRAGPHALAYLARRLDAEQGAHPAHPTGPAIPLMAGDARTGIPRRVTIDPILLTQQPQ